MVGERRLGGYQLVAPLATGGMAELFIAKTVGVSGFEKQVALKVIHPNFSSEPDFIRMLVDEAKLAVQLQHANIVQTYDLGHVDGQYYIAMELIDGADLYKVLKTSSERGLDFPIDVAMHVTSEVASGLDYAHRKNDPLGRPLQIVHRDVSPQNVLVSYEGEIKIVDFGIAKAALRNQQTQAGVIKGKYYYMSPEQAWGNKIDARTDVFSTGILLHEMLVGEMLYLEEDLDTLLKMVRAADIAPPSRKRPDVPPELDAIVMKALAKRPEDRYQSAADLSNALVRLLRSQFPDFGRVRVASFVREALEREASRAEITLPPAAPEDFHDENSLIFDLKKLQRTSAQDAHHADGKRRSDDETRGVSMPRPSHAPNDYEEAGSTEIDSKAILGLRDAGTDPDPVGSRRESSALRSARVPSPGFGDIGDDGEPTELSRSRRPSPPRPSPSFSGDDESTGQHARPSLPGAPSKPRRPSIPLASPIAPRRGGQLAPVASPPPTPRVAMGLGVSEPERRSATAPPSQQARGDSARMQVDTRDQRAEAALAKAAMLDQPPDRDMVPLATPTAPTPSPLPFALPDADAYGKPSSASGQASLIDWNAAPTVTPAAVPYSAVSSDFAALSSVRTGSPEHRRRRFLVLAAALLGVALVVLTVVLVWPDGPPRGSIEVVSLPPGATVRIDGTVLSKLTPIRIGDIDVRQPHRLAVSLRGYDSWESDAKFDNGEHEIRMQAILMPAVGTLDVVTIPAGAEAIVNGRISGTTPVKVGDLPPNEDVTLELRLRGYKVVYRNLQWKGKRALGVNIPLERAR